MMAIAKHEKEENLGDPCHPKVGSGLGALKKDSAWETMLLSQFYSQKMLFQRMSFSAIHVSVEIILQSNSELNLSNLS